MKGQVLVDLVAEFAEPSLEEMVKGRTWMENQLG